MEKLFQDGIKTLLDLNLKSLAQEGAKILLDQWEKFETTYNSSFLTYFDKVISSYSEIPTILSEERQNLLGLYQETFLTSSKGHENVSTNDVQNLLAISPYCWISGHGGIGKSTMLKYFALTSLSQKGNDKIPVYIELRKYNLEKKERRGLLKFIYDEMKVLKFELEYQYFEFMVNQGRFIFLLDAFDEINSEHMEQFLVELNECITSYDKNNFILTSRMIPSRNISTIHSLVEFTTNGLTLEQAVQLIQKITFYPQDLRQHFIERLKENLFSDYESIAVNPILLMLMFRTFGKNQNFPTEKTSFFLKVFDLLFDEHDGTKLGGYKRKFKSRLNETELKELFSIFCLKTYFHKENIQREFVKADFENYLKENPRLANTTVEDLIFDLSACLCLIYKEGENYYFVHNVFQEFYAAWCIYFLFDNEQQQQFFSSKAKQKTDHNWRLFYTSFVYFIELDAINSKYKFDENIVLPALERMSMEQGFTNYNDWLIRDYRFTLEKFGEKDSFFIFRMETNLETCDFDTYVGNFVLHLKQRDILDGFIISTQRVVGEKTILAALLDELNSLCINFKEFSLTYEQLNLMPKFNEFLTDHYAFKEKFDFVAYKKEIEERRNHNRDSFQNMIDSL